MRDPDLVQRAEQAATALEQAWTRWRTRHGLGSGPLPPVSSYVGYSVDEPWGQPRVVLGVEASEAERLAAMLDGHDCAAPGRAERAALPEPRQPAALEAAPDRTVPEEEPAVGVQSPREVASQAGSLVASQPASLVASPGRSAPAAGTPAELLGRADARLKDLAARVTALHPRPGAYDQIEPEATQSGLANGSGPALSQPRAADSAGRTRVLPAPTLSRAREADGEDTAPAWPAGESHAPTADSTV
jgi:hypothetical protein